MLGSNRLYLYPRHRFATCFMWTTESRPKYIRKGDVTLDMTTMNSALSEPQLQSDAAIAYVEARLWPNGPVCPKCGTMNRAGRLNGKGDRPGLWKCYACRKPFTVRMGIVLESSHVPMHIWLQVIYLMASSKKGFATRQIPGESHKEFSRVDTAR
jgi:transposase-like protein